jgi:uncharacterized membrane protein
MYGRRFYMASNKNTPKRTNDIAKKTNNVPKKNNNMPMIIISIAAIAVITVFVVTLLSGKPNNDVETAKQGESVKQEETVKKTGNLRAEAVTGGDLKILKDEISETARFYPYKIDNLTMEVFAVKAKDGTIRTALNTCQVCYGSGRGYYKQEGDTMVCQNCGNVFDVDMIGNARNGCNPVPVDDEYKTEEGSDIIISKTFLEGRKEMFANWTNGL